MDPEGGVKSVAFCRLRSRKYLCLQHRLFYKFDKFPHVSEVYFRTIDNAQLVQSHRSDCVARKSFCASRIGTRENAVEIKEGKSDSLADRTTREV